MLWLLMYANAFAVLDARGTWFILVWMFTPVIFFHQAYTFEAIYDSTMYEGKDDMVFMMLLDVCAWAWEWVHLD